MHSDAAQHIPMVRHIVGRLRLRMPRHIDFDDALADGLLGLVEASQRFDPSRGFRFSTFAFPRIHGAVVDGFRGRDKAANQEGTDPDELPDEGPGLEERLDTRRALAALGTAMADIPPVERALLAAHYGQGLSLASAGESLGLSRSWACRLHARALGRLRAALGASAPSALAANEIKERLDA